MKHVANYCIYFDRLVMGPIHVITHRLCYDFVDLGKPGRLTVEWPVSHERAAGDPPPLLGLAALQPICQVSQNPQNHRETII